MFLHFAESAATDDGNMMLNFGRGGAKRRFGCEGWESILHLNGRVEVGVERTVER